MLAPSTRWVVREALEFDCRPRGALGLARQLDEPVRAVVSALQELAVAGEIRYVGSGRFVAQIA